MWNKNVETFLCCDKEFEEAKTVLYGAPFDGTTSFRPGTRFGPDALRRESFGLETYSPYLNKDLSDVCVCDIGDIDICIGDAATALAQVEEAAENILADGKRPFLLGGDYDTIDGLTMTSDNPYPVEFIQVAGDGDRILNCNIYGPDQQGDSSTWVVNRGFVTQGNATDLLVRNNIFHTLRQPAYLNPGSTGTIMYNVVYNTRGYVVDQAIFLFSGNSWGIPENAVDIALLSGTVSGAPYDPLSSLEASNSSATVSE